MAFGTANGPTRFGPLLRAISAASTMVRVEGPPDPMTMPVRSLETSVCSSPASRIACSMATWFQAAPPPRNRMARRSTDSLASSVGAPWTCERKPSSAYLSERTTPDFASRSDASTSCVLLPMDETMPIPVTTTRLILRLVSLFAPDRGRRSGLARLRRRIVEQPDFEIERTIDHGTIGGEPAVGDAEHELGAHHALDVDAVYDLLHGRKHLA